ncbi:MAG: ABC transporter ATP-binding protein [Planctomycetota bacterium]|nr:ABC transporter ATP-binding protein [Planctomycetota bacterium]
MSDPNFQNFDRIISFRSLLQWRYLPATACSVFSSLALALALVCTTALVWLLIHVNTEAVGSVDRATGLVKLRESIGTHSIGGALSRLIGSVSWFQSTGTAVVCLLILICIFVLLRWVFWSVAEAVVESRVAASVQKLRQHIHRKSIRLEPSDFSGEHHSVADRLFRESTVYLETAGTRLGSAVLISLTDLIILFVVAMLTQWRVALETYVPLLLIRFAIRFETQRSDSSLLLLSEQVKRGLGRMAEGLRKTRIVTGFGMEQAEHEQFQSNLSLYREQCQHVLSQQNFGIWVRRVLSLLLVAVPATFLVTHVIRDGSIGIVAGLLIAGCLYFSSQTISRLESVQEIKAEGNVRAAEVTSFINRIPSVSQAPGAGFLEPMSRSLVFDQVAFSTVQHPRLIRGLDLRLGFGETVALLSLQPESAFALASMIPRLVDPDHGQILIDGRDIRVATLESLRAEAIMVGGNDPVFNATVLENITCGQSDITRQQALDAAKLVHADHFVRTLLKGYETVLGEHGVALDRGQIFRLSLARAIVRQPALLVIEEPNSAMDAATKAMLDDAYQRISGNRTIIFLPTRLSTVKKCSRIVLIHEGKIAVDGVHDQLVRTSELYRHWEYVQFNPYRADSEI